MNEDVYALKKEVTNNALTILNNKKYDFPTIMRAAKLLPFKWPDVDQVEDWIAALKSGKKIVNPLSPSEELKNYIRVTQNTYMADMKCVVAEVLEIIAKEHPDVTDWLKESDQP